MIGPGKYDQECTDARMATLADGVVLIVINGHLGSGFSAQMTPELQATLPDILERAAREIRESVAPHETVQ